MLRGTASVAARLTSPKGASDATQRRGLASPHPEIGAPSIVELSGPRSRPARWYERNSSTRRAELRNPKRARLTACRKQRTARTAPDRQTAINSSAFARSRTGFAYREPRRRTATRLDVIVDQGTIKRKLIGLSVVRIISG